MLLFVLACGLSVTLGVINFINLAHGSFAMAGGYETAAYLVNRVRACRSWPPCHWRSWSSAALIGLLLERTLYVHVYGRRAIWTRCCSRSAWYSCR